MTLKVVVVGPPHSGKSVFLGGLTKNLPRNAYYLFRACPDGEGSWTYRSPSATKYRRKGTFSKKIVDWYCQSLSSCSLADIVLVDVGGKVTPDNRRILCEGGVTHAIILAGDVGAIPEWESFLKECGVSVVATLHSDYHGTADEVSGPVMRVHHLERGEDVSSRPAIQEVACQLLELAEKNNSNKKEEITMNQIFNGNVLEVSALAETLGKEAVERTLPNGRVVSQIIWEGGDLANISRLLHNNSAEMEEVVRINGAAPAWLVAALTHECHPRQVALNSPDGYIDVGCQRPDGEGHGENLAFDVSMREDGWVVVTASAVDPSVPFSPADLGGWTPPALGMGAKVILSGRLPNWGMVSLAMAYHGQAKAVALFQPGTGSTVCWTHSKEVALGDVIPE